MHMMVSYVLADVCAGVALCPWWRSTPIVMSYAHGGVLCLSYYSVPMVVPYVHVGVRAR